MQGDTQVIEFLNEQLTAELTAINQYFLHAKMQENWGYTKLAAHTRYESIDEMKHAEVLTDRILFLEGLPNFQRLFPLRIGETVKEQFNADIVTGKPTLEPRLTPVPVRIPLPAAIFQGSIYENQRTLGNRYFAVYEEAQAVEPT